MNSLICVVVVRQKKKHIHRHVFESWRFGQLFEVFAFFCTIMSTKCHIFRETQICHIFRTFRTFLVSKYDTLMGKTPRSFFFCNDIYIYIYNVPDTKI